MRRPMRACLTATLALLVTGCQSAFFGIVNRGSAQPDASVVYDAPRGLSLDIYRPDTAGAGAPVVLFFYGGSWQHGMRAQYRFVGDRLARHGVVTIVADYRTWPAAGFPGFMSDAARAVHWTYAHAREYGGDPERLFVAGHSAGAQIAALLGTDARHLATVGMRPQQLAGVIGLSGPYDFNISGKLEDVFGPREQWPDAMALNFVDGDEPPFLLVHGDQDHTVDVGNSRKLDFALRRAGIDSTLEIVADGNHFVTAAAFYDPDKAPDVLPAIVEFIEGADRRTDRRTK